VKYCCMHNSISRVTNSLLITLRIAQSDNCVIGAIMKLSFDKCFCIAPRLSISVLIFHEDRRPLRSGKIMKRSIAF
jgi:hypothetical protein